QRALRSLPTRRSSDLILALRREHRSGGPTRKASLRFLKVRNGVRGGIDAEFNPKRLAFEEARPAPKPAQAAINVPDPEPFGFAEDRKSTRLNSSHVKI